MFDLISGLFGYIAGVGSVIGASLLFAAKETPVGDNLYAKHPADLVLTGTRCVQGKQRHLYSGKYGTPDGARCVRCDSPNPKYRVPEAVLTSTEGQQMTEAL